MTKATSIQVQVESRTLWDLVVAETCGCYDLSKACDQLIDDGEYRLVKLPCGYKCENEVTKRRYLKLLTNPELLRREYPIFWKRTVFQKEIAALLGWLTRWDPNGDWDIYDVLATPWQTLETIENLQEELEDNYEDVPGWINSAIDYLMVLAG